MPVIMVTAVAIFGTAACVPLLAWTRPRLRGPLVAGAAVVVGYEASKALQRLWFRPRPFVVMHVRPLFPHGASTSFPSPTVAIVAAVACVAWLAWPALGRVLGAAVLIVAVGCVYVDVHYVSDVVVGALLGAAAGGACWLASAHVPRGRAMLMRLRG
jgi:undecaprenyl-diphosphatase